jgi:hypothetical protein
LGVVGSFTFASAEVKAELDALPADMRAYFKRIASRRA